MAEVFGPSKSLYDSFKLGKASGMIPLPNLSLSSGPAVSGVNPVSSFGDIENNISGFKLGFFGFASIGAVALVTAIYLLKRK